MPSQDRANDKVTSPKLGISSLPPELVENVMKQVSTKKDLANLRLVCKELCPYATKELFKDVFVSPLEEHISTWNSTSQNDYIRQIPRHAIIHTHPEIEDEDLYDDGDDEGISEDFEAALDALSSFPNLDSIEIAFTCRCVGQDEEPWGPEVPETISQRKVLLKCIFRAIKDRASEEKNRTVRKLTIINLQNCPVPEFTSSDLFRDIMGQLEELHISMIQEYNDGAPDHDYTKIELQTFPAHLVKDWLKPIAGNLTALSIYHRNDNWGPFPGYFDARGIDFPKLNTLALGYYTLAHDNDLDWILAIKSLKKLILHNVMIASWLRIGDEEMSVWKVDTRDWTELPKRGARDWANGFAYGGKWSQFLDRMAADLPNLVDFRFDQASLYPYSDGGPPYGLHYRDTCGVRIFPRRYICFDDGILPTHWKEADDKGDMYSWLDEGFPNAHQEYFDEDQKSLDRLLDKLRK
jgi:hypothetical protein